MHKSSRPAEAFKNNKIISNIVFTKNRPLQLHAYLESLYRFFPAELIQTYILYKTELFEEQYEEVFRSFTACKVIRENDFSDDFLGILNQIDSKYILFGIDDVVYFDSVDFKVIDEAFDKNDDIFGFSLRFGENILANGQDIVSEFEIAGQKIYKLNWPDGKTKITRYPFELCATIYPTELVRKIIFGSRHNNAILEKLFTPGCTTLNLIGLLLPKRKILKAFGYFFNPNTLESWNCRWCQQNIDKVPPFVYFQKQCAAAIQVNMVNTSTENVVDACELTVEKLNEMYKQGYRFDIKQLVENKPPDTHTDSSYFKLLKG